MKKSLTILSAVAALFTIAVSCNEPEDEIKALGAPVLSVDNETLAFDEYGDDAAITFSWTAPEEGVSYFLMISKAEDTGFASCKDFQIEGTSKTFTSAEVRDFANELKVDLSAGVTFIAKVMATAGAGRTSYSNVVEFSAVKNNAGYATIYPIGAMDWDWDPAQAEAMKTDDGIVYTWTGIIKANNNFKFLCQNNGEWLPSYNRDANAAEYWTAYKKTQDWEPDDCFMIDKGGQYTITLNIQDLSVKVEPCSEGFQKLYPIGAMAWGWDLENAEAMETIDGITFTWTGEITANLDFKFECQKTAWQPSYNRDANAEDYWTAYYKTQDWEPDTQWKVDITGVYTLTINTETLKVTAEPQFDPTSWEKIYPIGAMSWGWDRATAEEMTTEDGISYYWEGNIDATQGFKFLTADAMTGDVWMPCYCRNAEAENYWTAYRKTEDWEPDNCFNVAESGKYKLCLNIVDLTVTAEKVVEKEQMFPVGGAFACGWDNTKAEPMMTWNDKDYFWAGWLNEGTFKFLCHKDSWLPGYNRDPQAEYYWTMIRRNDGGADDTCFDITKAGQYIMELNTEELTISCVEDPTFDYPQIYPIGAMSWGWDATQAEHMFTYDGEEYFWIGEIKANNDFKFLCSNDGVNWIPSYNRDEEAEDYWTAYKKTEDWQADTQFKVTEGGIYKLTLNVTTLKVTCTKLGDVQ